MSVSTVVRSQFLWLFLMGCGTSLSAAVVDFEKTIAPILAKRCLECHSGAEAKGGLDLSRRSSALSGGDSGPAYSEGKPQKSLLISRLHAGEMPPASQGRSQKLPAAEIDALERWIADGAPWPKGRRLDLYERTSDVRAGLDWWSLQSVVRPKPPFDSESPIDAFIRVKLDAAELEPAPQADRRTLIRRATFDLTGLPPKPGDIEAFVADESVGAYESLVDRLLDSKRYGERQARHWLDVVRFAETCGYERDHLKPGIWKYRDWVIDAFNDDMPYDRFVTDQLAGDEVDYRDERSVIATGMLRAGTWNDEPNDPADYVYTRLEDMVHTTSSAFLALTVKCARCHDHKFDPIRQTDYYRTAAFFWAGHIGQANLGGPSKEQLGFDVFGWTDKGPVAKDLRLLHKGERSRPGEVVAPGFLSSIPQLDKPLAPPPIESKTTRRRLQFARWITDSRNPLTARVMVNRIWLQHFGQGLVRTPNNFGFKGAPPTHPKLLDWLAAEFVAGGWRVKRMHKMLMMSATYRQSSNHPKHAEYSTRDFANRHWWRAPRRRLDAESLRDALLATSGQLELKMGGPSFFPKMSSEALEGLSRKSNAWKASSLVERSRRSVYMMTKRSRLLPFMTTFDFGDTTLPCAQRGVTIVAPQALALLNNHFVHEQSLAMARRVSAEIGEDSNAQIRHAWRIALGRPPSDKEFSVAKKHLTAQRKNLKAQRSEEARSASLTREKSPAIRELSARNGLSLWLRADRGVEVDEDGGVRFWRDASSASKQRFLPRDASQADPNARPKLVGDAVHVQPAIRFDGKRQYLHLAGSLLSSQEFTIFAVVSSDAKDDGHREIISNWHRRGRSTSSVFLGTTRRNAMRLSDGFAGVGSLESPEKPFLLTAENSSSGARLYQNGRQLASGPSLPQRDLAAPWVLGTQGNYGSEWWFGDMAEIIVYDRALSSEERRGVELYLATRYALQSPKENALAIDLLALSSLCHVLFNTNEFIYLD